MSNFTSATILALSMASFPIAAKSDNSETVIAGLQRVEPQCYEPERDSPRRIEELKQDGGKICAPDCYDETVDPRRIIESRI